MSDVVIKTENLSKVYRLGTIGSGTLSADISRWWAKVRHKPDPFLKIGKQAFNNEAILALDDVNFEVKQGEAFGIIGKNGAGKSTLLKILSRITAPSTGQVKIKGRIAALLEVGTGFHPELTGRENVFLNGAILGMSKREIRNKLDEIISFSGVEKFIDTPVKRYSSGMRVRLAFAVAAHLDPEILIIDEVLAVGDAEFQKKCLGKMQEVSGEGRTVLFVSHNMNAVNNLCQKAIVLENGILSFNGNVEEAISHYKINISGEGSGSNSIEFNKNLNIPIQIVSATLLSSLKETSTQFEHNGDIALRVKFEVKEKKRDSTIGIIIEDAGSNIILVSTDSEFGETIIGKKEKGLHEVDIIVPCNILKPGYYSITLAARGNLDKAYQREPNCLRFEVIDTQTYRGMKGLYRKQAIIAPIVQWKDKN